MDSSIEPQRWTQIQEVLHRVLEEAPENRQRFLHDACGDDADLRREVTSLLEALEWGGGLGTLDTMSLSDDAFPVAPLAPSLEDQLEKLKLALAGRYDIVEPIGAGGMAVVYLAEDLRHHRKVAVKVLRPDLAASLAAERFLREIQISARLHHPHILPLYDSGAEVDLLYFVMPLVEGENLAQRLQREGSLPPGDALQIGVEIASALEYAHQQGFVHRDIKPANILLSTTAGHAVIADFGIARAVSAAGGDELTLQGWAIGTPGYMSPEQAGGHPVTYATDIYSLGMVIYEALTGYRWPGVDASPLRTWVAVPYRVGRILRRALARKPSDRWQDTGKFREALWEARVRAGSFWVWRLVTIAVVVAILLMLAALVGTIWNGSP
jgi:serine/threonine-protein kinase